MIQNLNSKKSSTLYNQLYNKAYEKITPGWLGESALVNDYLERNSQSLREFYELYCEQFSFPKKDYRDLKVLDLGCGLGASSLYFAQKGAQVTGIDVSELAISGAKEIAANKGLNVEFICRDLSQKAGENSPEKYDIIFDSHLLHCLTSDEHRQNYLEFVKQSMGHDSLFLLETMVFQKQLRTPVGYSLDEKFTLWREFSDTQENKVSGELPVRRIMPGIDLEDEIKTAGLDISYLYFHAELSFNVFEDYTDYPHQNLPQTARLVAQLRSLNNY